MMPTKRYQVTQQSTRVSWFHSGRKKGKVSETSKHGSQACSQSTESDCERTRETDPLCAENRRGALAEIRDRRRKNVTVHDGYAHWLTLARLDPRGLPTGDVVFFSFFFCFVMWIVPYRGKDSFR